jgi:hypothetical protein
MLVQDTLTGYVHEVPDGQFSESEFAEYPDQIAEAQMVYDGLGNPVGFLKSLKRFARKLAPVVSQLAPFVPIPGAAVLAKAAQGALPGLVRRFAPTAQRLVRAVPSGVVQQFAPIAQAFQQPVAPTVPAPVTPSPGEAAPVQGVEGYYGEAAPVVQAVPGQPVRPMPPGWIRRPSPYQGKQGRRVYLRCVAWPGPRGLVPANAAQAPWVAPAPSPGAPTVVPGAPGTLRAPTGRRIIRRHYRR